MIDDEFDEDEIGTQPAQRRNQKMNDVDTDKSAAEIALSQQERNLKREREENQKQREEASEEYETKTKEAKEKKAEEDAKNGVEPQPVPEECGSFEGYGEFIVPADVNIRHQDHKKGDRVALNWDEYQSLRASEIYCEPVPQPGEQQDPNAPPVP